MSDHLSSPRALRDLTIDLTDLYFFPVPDMPGRLAVVVNVFPLAQPGAVFSDAVSVIEVDAAHVLGADRRPVWVVAAETVSQGACRAPGSSGWVGRRSKTSSCPSTAMTQSTRPSTSATFYNLEDVFAVNPAAETYRARLDANLAMFDELDGAIAWPFPAGNHHPLTEMWLNDRLVLDTKKPFSERGYLDLERAALTGQSPTTCGGRWLNEDVIDLLYSVIVRGWEGPPIRDGVDHATIPALPKFPYLAAGNPYPPIADPAVPVGHD